MVLTTKEQPTWSLKECTALTDLPHSIRLGFLLYVCFIHVYFTPLVFSCQVFRMSTSIDIARTLTTKGNACFNNNLKTS